jgi:hypothetical protein
VKDTRRPGERPGSQRGGILSEPGFLRALGLDGEKIFFLIRVELCISSDSLMSDDTIRVLISTIGSVAIALFGFLVEFRRGRNQKPGASTAKTAARRPILVFASILALGLSIVSLLTTFFWTQASRPKPETLLPVGSVVAYWGYIKEGSPPQTPPGFEICDGDPVTTPDSLIRGQRKPDLRDAFLKGALPGVSDVREKPEFETGGSNEKRDLTHHHAAGPNMRALIGTPGQSYFFLMQERGGSFEPTFQVGGGTFGRPGDRPKFGVAVEGDTSDSRLSVDIRPKFVSVFYIIKVK